MAEDPSTPRADLSPDMVQSHMVDMKSLLGDSADVGTDEIIDWKEKQ